MHLNVTAKEFSKIRYWHDTLSAPEFVYKMLQEFPQLQNLPFGDSVAIIVDDFIRVQNPRSCVRVSNLA